MTTLYSSGNFDLALKDCGLSDMNRFTIGNLHQIKPSTSSVYFENHAIFEPRERCHFKTVKGRLPTHIDAFYDVEGADDCKTKCLNTTSLCRSYSVLNKRLCLLTHDTDATRLPYINVSSYEADDVTTYEIIDCFGVELDCKKKAMVLRVTSSKIFNGKIYSKRSPSNCVKVIKMGAVNFELQAHYNDISCGLTQVKDGQFTGDFVIQHKEKVITTNDILIQASCQFDLQSQRIESEKGYALIDSYNLKNSEGAPYVKNEFKINVNVEKPVLRFRVIYDNFTELTEVTTIGAPLAIMVEVMNKSSPYDIFVRELVAYDAEGFGKIKLINQHGCSLEPTVFNEFNKIAAKPTKLVANFFAFKFASSDTVQFRALVSFCIPHCEPIKCQIGYETFNNEPEQSYLRRRREVKYNGKLIFYSKQDLSVP